MDADQVSIGMITTKAVATTTAVRGGCGMTQATRVLWRVIPAVSPCVQTVVPAIVGVCMMTAAVPLVVRQNVRRTHGMISLRASVSPITHHKNVRILSLI